MVLLLRVVLFSWFVHSILYIPFIRLLYTWRFQRLAQKHGMRLKNVLLYLINFIKIKSGLR